MSYLISHWFNRLKRSNLHLAGELSEQSKLTSGIAIVAITILLLQIPVVAILWPHSQTAKSVLLVACIIMMGISIYCNLRQNVIAARNLLTATYIFYILISSWLWVIDLNQHYFLVLGVIICPFIFSRHEPRQLWVWLICYAASFLALELLFQQTNQPDQGHLYPTLSVLKLCNSIGFVCALGLCCLYINTLLSRQRSKLLTEKERVCALLRCALPQHIVNKLNAGSGNIVAEYHPQVTIIFADIQGFSSICRRVNALQLVSVLNTLYVSFDHITKKHRLEKIKTNGDQYIAAAGLVSCPRQAAVSACNCALDMQATFEVLSKKLSDSVGITSGLRIGIATGDAIAGVLGADKFSFDLWGPTVNLASRLESQGLNKKIQVSRQTRNLASHKFHFSHRGKIKFKGVGTLDAYWLQNKLA